MRSDDAPSSEMFSYTSGRHLVNEEKRQEERHVEFSRDELCIKKANNEREQARH
jgi:hypothetical protein